MRHAHMHTHTHREWEININVRETLGCLLYVPHPGIKPTICVACALTGDRTTNILVARIMLQLTELPVQGPFFVCFSIFLPRQ